MLRCGYDTGFLTEVLAEPEGVAPAREPPAFQPPDKDHAYLLKIGPTLRELAAQEGLTKPERLEVILDHTPGEAERGWQTALTEAVPGIAIEGRLGPLVTVMASPKQAPALAALPVVSVVRLPRPALVQTAPAQAGRRARTQR